METPQLNSEQLKGGCGGCRNSIAISYLIVVAIWSPVMIFCPLALQPMAYPAFGAIACLALIYAPALGQLPLKLRIDLVHVIAYVTIIAESRALQGARGLSLYGIIPLFLALLAWLKYIGPKISQFMQNRADQKHSEENRTKLATLTEAVMSANDEYETLGVTSASPLAEIKTSFREKCLILHPDNKAIGNLQAFNKVAHAYEVLIKRMEHENALACRKDGTTKI